MNAAISIFQSTREYLTPVMTESAFLDKGMLTPDEFVRAGDQLIRTCPSWSWAAGDSTKARPYLPLDKQFLVTKNVPCYSRVSYLKDSTQLEEAVEGDWCSPSMVVPEENSLDDELLIEADGSAKKATAIPAVVEKATPAAAAAAAAAAAGSAATEKAEAEEDTMEDASLALDEFAAMGVSGGSNVIKSRRYDVSITYDNYYRTPRIWLFGYNENGSPLSSAHIFEDIMQDYAEKTVTIEAHPHMQISCASVHPCQHSAAMLNIIGSLVACGATPNVEQYLFVFLKFIQSVVPTIEYDYTSEVRVGGASSSSSVATSASGAATAAVATADASEKSTTA
jgi:ubiquitin-like-conjugating enzyme ATG3